MESTKEPTRLPQDVINAIDGAAKVITASLIAENGSNMIFAERRIIERRVGGELAGAAHRTREFIATNYPT